MCGSQAGRQKEIEGRVRGQKEIDCEQFKRQKKLFTGVSFKFQGLEKEKIKQAK